MKINRRSWHARYYAYWNRDGDPYPNNLCKYFWTWVAMVLAHAFLGVIVIIFSPMILGGFVIIYAGEKIRERRSKTPREPNVIVESVRAIKNKYCPRIEWI